MTQTLHILAHLVIRLQLQASLRKEQRALIHFGMFRDIFDALHYLDLLPMLRANEVVFLELSVGLCKTYRPDFPEIWWKGEVWDKEKPATFWSGSVTGGSENQRSNTAFGLGGSLRLTMPYILKNQVEGSKVTRQ